MLPALDEFLAPGLRQMGAARVRRLVSQEFVNQFDGLLSVLAKPHGLLVDSEWQGVDLRALVVSNSSPACSGDATG
ncbi:hypothetical protein J6524_31850 [Bradyrhizobium sp. WSM 1738]|uniref:HWE histidine kinase domain-containing protein n=1 Tax=Bradyrhizobium hereditatis TaxID=2821405 RepID=UPI001CE3A2CA|nr:HWE histidine kinase domain-containing protein [Bradyrhizobium hereditatis]MCA6119433.1 hypothetical protein [Bradyrhizobium hereditatis]